MRSYYDEVINRRVRSKEANVMTTQPIEHQSEPKVLSLIKPLDQEHIEKAIQLLDEWMTDESGYDEQTWPELKEALEREREHV